MLQFPLVEFIKKKKKQKKQQRFTRTSVKRVYSYALWRIASLAITVNCLHVQLCAGIERLLVCSIYYWRCPWEQKKREGAEDGQRQRLSGGNTIITVGNPLSLTTEADGTENNTFTELRQQLKTLRKQVLYVCWEVPENAVNHCDTICTKVWMSTY